MIVMPEAGKPELDRNDMCKMLKKYLSGMNREYELETGGIKHLAENIVDNGEQKCEAEIEPVKRYDCTEEIVDPETGIVLTAHMTFIFTHKDAVPKKKIIELHRPPLVH